MQINQITVTTAINGFVVSVQGSESPQPGADPQPSGKLYICETVGEVTGLIAKLHEPSPPS